MSTFAVKVKRILAIEPHSNADAIEFAVIDGYRSIVRKGEFSVGELIVYIPEAALVPEWLLKKLNFWDEENQKGKLSGSQGNIVKPVKLRGQLSQGICFKIDQDLYAENDDVAELLGITKYIPEVPSELKGEVFVVERQHTLSFDVENWKSFPNIIKDGEEIGFRVFAVATGYRNQQHYLSWDTITEILKPKYGFETVPVLYRGPFSKEAMKEHTDGQTTLGANHIREGIVIVPAEERYDEEIGRVCLKSVSVDFLTRSGGTEYN